MVKMLTVTEGTLGHQDGSLTVSLIGTTSVSRLGAETSRRVKWISFKSGHPRHDPSAVELIIDLLRGVSVLGKWPYSLRCPSRDKAEGLFIVLQKQFTKGSEFVVLCKQIPHTGGMTSTFDSSTPVSCLS